MTTVLAYVAYFRKALVAAVGVGTSVLAANVLPARYALYVSTGLGIATAILTYVVPNVERVIEEWGDEGPVDGISASDLIAEYTAEHAHAAPELPAEAAPGSTPTSDTPQVFEQPETTEFQVSELLDALGHTRTP